VTGLAILSSFAAQAARRIVTRRESRRPSSVVVLHAGFALLLAAALLATRLHAAHAEDLQSYGASAKATIVKLLDNKTFTLERGCEEAAPCRELLARLRAGDFVVVEPADRSEAAKPALADYVLLRRRCPGLDPLRITVAHRTYAATRGFAVYHVALPGSQKREKEVLLFRAQHFVQQGAASSDEATVLTPGIFISIDPRACRVLSSARAEDGDWLARHNAIGGQDHASELVRLGDRYLVLNLAPIAGPSEARASWSYTLELWDLGPQLDADLRMSRREYLFSYRAAQLRLTAKAARSAQNGSLPLR